MYKPHYFTIQELVHPQILEDIGEPNSWARLDVGVLKDLDKIREIWGSEIYINSGPHDSRGLRPPDDPDGAYYSVHKQGKAFDLVPKNGDTYGLYDLIWTLILDHQLEAINTLEDIEYTKTWVHVASMNVSHKPNVIKP